MLLHQLPCIYEPNGKVGMMPTRDITMHFYMHGPFGPFPFVLDSNGIPIHLSNFLRSYSFSSH